MVDMGVCQSEYGTTTTQEHTGVYEWDENDLYNESVKEWQALKLLENYSFVIVTAEQANSTDFVNNYLTNNEAIVLQFNPEGFEMIDTSVSVETSLQEVSDEVGLKKAEAEYEADMKKIDRKDARYDTEIAKLETERTAVVDEMDTLKTVAKDNVERTFKLFS
jgi:TRAP-type mannitol/chloroaromatic compound transport system substrate-binding protein